MEREIAQLEGACQEFLVSERRSRQRALRVADDTLRLLRRHLDNTAMAEERRVLLQQEMRETEAMAEHLRRVPEEAPEALTAAAGVAVGAAAAPRRQRPPRRARAPLPAGEAALAAAADAPPDPAGE